MVRSAIHGRYPEISTYLYVSGNGQYDCWRNTGGTCSSWTDAVCSRPSYPEDGSLPLRVVEEVREFPAKPRGRRFFRTAFFLSPSPDVSCRSSGPPRAGLGPGEKNFGPT